MGKQRIAIALAVLHLFCKLLLSSFYVSRIVLVAENTKMSKMGPLCILAGNRPVNKQLQYNVISALLEIITGYYERSKFRGGL